MQMFEEEKILLKQQLAWFLLIKAEHEGVHGFVLFFFPHHCMLIDLKQMLVYTVFKSKEGLIVYSWRREQPFWFHLLNSGFSGPSWLSELTGRLFVFS